MAEDEPLFLDEDAPRKADNPEPAPAPGFDPFAGVAVAADIAAVAAQEAAAAEEGNEAPVAETPSSPGSDSGQKAILPERAGNLWPCPHCGAKNKPERTTCRSCGKDPDEPVAVPVTEQPWFKPVAIAAVAVLLLLVLTVTCSML